MTEEFIILQQLDPSRRKETFNSILNNLNSVFLFIVALSFMAICIALHSLKPTKSKAANRKDKMSPFKRATILLRTLPGVRWSFTYTATAIGVFLLFFDLHLFLVKLLFSNVIQVEKTICDTSNILRNAHDLVATEKVAIGH